MRRSKELETSVKNLKATSLMCHDTSIQLPLATVFCMAKPQVSEVCSQANNTAMSMDYNLAWEKVRLCG